jgi:CNT family concentrative nucleoside transporter
MVLNELVAYTYLGGLAKSGALAARSVTIATFALCGFANLSSIGIQIGGIGALAPNRRNELAKLGFRAMLAGTMANLMSASIVGMLIK